MGIGNLSDVVRAYTARQDDPVDTIVREAGVDYARLYFDSSPTVQRASWELLASFGDDSQTYYWRVLGALGVMHLLRNDPERLERLAELHDRLPSAALVLHPPGGGERYADATQLGDAVARGRLVSIHPSNGAHITIDPQLMRALAPLTKTPADYLALRPRAARFLEYLAAKVYELSGEKRPLAVMRAAYDDEAASALTPHDPGAVADADVHGTGFAFDMRRRYGSGAQAAAFQWALERLEALGLIAWTRGRSVIHVVVSPRATAAARS